MRTPSILTALALVLAPATVAQTVDYPDSTINSPQGQYPIYTPPTGAVVRGQMFCPSTFAGLPQTPMLVTKVGVQIAGNLPYTSFVGRAGATSVTTLGASFAGNLPDQRVQFDLSGRNLPGGGTGTTATTQINIWVEFDLCHPFVWKPGDGLVVDITAQSQVAGQYCRSAIGTGVARMLNLAYTPTTTTGSPSAAGGIKLRFVFAPLYQPVEFGTGCPGTNNVAPKLSATGSTQIASSTPVLLGLTQARPSAPGFLVISTNCWDLPIFGGCTIYPHLSILVGATTSASGTTGFPLIMPTSSALDGISVTLQYAIDDPNTQAAPMTVSLSNGLRLVLNN
jgi:hypothetical protein